MFLFLFLHFSVSNFLLFSMAFAVVHSIKSEKSSDSWSECSKTCGEGTKAKLVCKNEEKCEEIVVICNLMPCPRKWKGLFFRKLWLRLSWHYHVKKLIGFVFLMLNINIIYWILIESYAQGSKSRIDRRSYYAM